MRVRFLLIGLAVVFAAGILAASSYAEIDPKTAIGVWFFDEGSGDKAKDSSGNGNEGKLLRNINWVDGKFGKALEFDGNTGTYVNCGKGASLNSPSTLTIVAWVKPMASSKFDYTAILGRGLSASWGIYTTKAPNNLYIRLFTKGGQTQLTSTKAFETEVWSHFAVAYNGKKDLDIF